MDAFSLDHLNETEFEQFCYDLLAELGFVNINWRKGTGLSSSPSDRGRDIVCQLHHKGIDGKEYFETWFVECKHYKKGVPPDKIHGAITWAGSERPDRLLIIASNFLSNPTKDYLDNYQRNNNPSFKIQTWERPDIERITTGKSALLRKYRISGDFPFLSIMHPVHLAYLNSIPYNTLNYLFDCLNGLDAQHREEFIGFVNLPIIQPRSRKPITGNESLASLFIDDTSYDAFRKKCYEIVSTGIISQMVLTYFIVSFTLQSLFELGDTTSTDKVIANLKGFVAFLHREIKEKPEEKEQLQQMIEKYQQDIKIAPEKRKKHYEQYVYFCEHVLSKLLTEKYLRGD